jgi:sulfur carrier protein
MEFTFNGLTKSPTSPLTLQQLLDQELPDKQKSIAVSVNNTVVPRNNWSTHTVLHQDNILVFTAAQGG